MPLIRVQLMELPPMLHDVILAVVDSDRRLLLADADADAVVDGATDAGDRGVDVVVTERDAAQSAAVQRLLYGVPGLRVVAISAASGETDGYVMRPEQRHYGPVGLDALADLLAGQTAVGVPAHGLESGVGSGVESDTAPGLEGGLEGGLDGGGACDG
jgi:hypothetical protein